MAFLPFCTPANIGFIDALLYGGAPSSLGVRTGLPRSIRYSTSVQQYGGGMRRYEYEYE